MKTSGEKLTKKSTGGATKNHLNGIGYSGSNLEAVCFGEGWCTPNGASAFYYEYTIKDHLGNARINFRANGAAVTFLQELHYYPFGMLMEGIGTAQVTNNGYKYNYKELNEDLGLNLSDYGARWYDASLGRWWSVDPIAEKFVSSTGYSYVQCNPIIWIDPNGKENIIYLVGVQGSKMKDLTEVAKNANKIFKELGLETRVEIFKGSSADFDVSKLDKTDGVAVMGFKSAVSKFTDEKLSSISSDGFRGNIRSDGFQKDDSTPEMSERNGKVIALDSDRAASSWSTNTHSSIGLAMGFALAHGAGHNAGIGHLSGGIMINGQEAANRILINTSPYEDLKKVFTEEYIKMVRSNFGSYRTLMDFVCPGNDDINEQYQNEMVVKFGYKQAKVNYKY